MYAGGTIPLRLLSFASSAKSSASSRECFSASCGENESGFEYMNGVVVFWFMYCIRFW